MQVARPNKKLEGLLQKFVCVRMTNIDTLDLSIFQFDSELTWAVFFMNADKTIYGRYGTRSAKDKKIFFDRKSRKLPGADKVLDVTLLGFKKAAKAALEIHKQYQKDPQKVKKSLQGKIGPKPLWKTPTVIGRNSKKICIHCHHITSESVLELRAKNKNISDKMLWSYPMPDLLGLVLDPQEKATVKNIKSDSEAAKSGFTVGDQILEANGQKIISIADFQWVLHHALEPSVAQIQILRNKQKRYLRLSLPEKWRRRGSFGWRWRSCRAIWGSCFGGYGWHLESLEISKRKELGLEKEPMAVVVAQKPNFKNQWIFEKQDIIVNVDNRLDINNESDFLAYVVREKKIGDSINLTVIRNKKRLKAKLKVLDG